MLASLPPPHPTIEGSGAGKMIRSECDDGDLYGFQRLNRPVFGFLPYEGVGCFIHLQLPSPNC